MESVWVNESTVSPSEAPTRRYFLVCCGGREQHWWNRFFRPGFRHCYVLIWEGVTWLYIDPTLYRTHVSILEHYQDNHPREWIDDDSASYYQVAVEPHPTRMRVPWCLGPLTCVEGCKALLGIREFLVWTPWQLAQHASKMICSNESG